MMKMPMYTDCPPLLHSGTKKNETRLNAKCLHCNYARVLTYVQKLCNKQMCGKVTHKNIANSWYFRSVKAVGVFNKRNFFDLIPLCTRFYNYIFSSFHYITSCMLTLYNIVVPTTG